MTEGFWSVKIGGTKVYDWSLENAVQSAVRVKRYASHFRAGMKGLP